jgi:hypothetical protein
MAFQRQLGMPDLDDRHLLDGVAWSVGSALRNGAS